MYPKSHGAKSRWILQGFHDPDITLLNRTVPTPATEDVPMVLQVLASMRAEGFTADVSSAFSQGIQGQRDKPLYANPPKEDIPGEDDDVIVELLAEIDGLISGPPGWRKTLLTEFRDLNYARHLLAPCVVLLYEEIAKVEKIWIHMHRDRRPAWRWYWT